MGRVTGTRRWVMGFHRSSRLASSPWVRVGDGLFWGKEQMCHLHLVMVVKLIKKRPVEMVSNAQAASVFF